MLGGGGNLLIGDLIELQFLGSACNPNLGAAIALVLMVPNPPLHEHHQPV